MISFRTFLEGNFQTHSSFRSCEALLFSTSGPGPGPGPAQLLSQRVYVSLSLFQLGPQLLHSRTVFGLRVLTEPQ